MKTLPTGSLLFPVLSLLTAVFVGSKLLLASAAGLALLPQLPTPQPLLQLNYRPGRVDAPTVPSPQGDRARYVCADRGAHVRASSPSAIPGGYVGVSLPV